VSPKRLFGRLVQEAETRSATLRSEHGVEWFRFAASLTMAVVSDGRRGGFRELLVIVAQSRASDLSDPTALLGLVTQVAGAISMSNCTNRAFACFVHLELIDKGLNVAQINAVRVRHSRAVPVGDEGVHGQHDVCASKEVRPA